MFAETEKVVITGIVQALAEDPRDLLGAFEVLSLHILARKVPSGGQSQVLDSALPNLFRQKKMQKK